MRKVSIAFLVFICLCSVCVNANATEKQRKITIDQAKMLVLATLTPKQRRLPGLVAISEKDMGVSDKDLDSSRYYSFTVVWDSHKEGVFGNYVVDTYTGDVFDGVMEDCDGYSNKKLRALQKQIRHSLHLTNAQYKKIKTKGPMCVD